MNNRGKKPASKGFTDSRAYVDTNWLGHQVVSIATVKAYGDGACQITWKPERRAKWPYAKYADFLHEPVRMPTGTTVGVELSNVAQGWQGWLGYK